MQCLFDIYTEKDLSLGQHLSNLVKVIGPNVFPGQKHIKKSNLVHITNNLHHLF